MSLSASRPILMVPVESKAATGVRGVAVAVGAFGSTGIIMPFLSSGRLPARWAVVRPHVRPDRVEF
jgi:hypothetical protein